MCNLPTGCGMEGYSSCSSAGQRLHRSAVQVLQGVFIALGMPAERLPLCVPRRIDSILDDGFTALTIEQGEARAVSTVTSE